MLLYGGMTKRKYAINTMIMLYAFSVVLVVWVLLGYELAFGPPTLRLGSYYLLGTPIVKVASETRHLKETHEAYVVYSYYGRPRGNVGFRG
jgi:ammonia channel protein AmtB